MQEPPRVTIVDPSRPDPGPADELGEDGPPSRRGLYAVLLLVAALVAWRVVDTVLDRRAAAAEERRLAAVVELEVTARFSGGGSSSLSPEDVATVDRTVSIRNTGPREVEVLAAEYGALRFEGSLPAAPGREVVLQLRTEVDCAVRPADVPAGPDLLVGVRGADGRVRELVLPLPEQVFLAQADELRRACGYLDLVEAASAFVASTVRRDDAVVVGLQLANRGRTPVDLVAVAGGAGMRVEVLTAVADGGDDGPVVPLPLRLPGLVDGIDQLRDVVLRLTVADCAAVERDAAPFDGRAPTSVATTFGEPDGPTSTGFSALEGGDVEALVREVCG